MVEGQCKVILENIGERRLFDNRNVSNPGKVKIKIKQKETSLPSVQKQRVNEVFVDFNPDNSVLRQINFMQRNFDNARIVLDSEGREIKNKINFNQ